jgi:hypothetical protein
MAAGSMDRGRTGGGLRASLIVAACMAGGAGVASAASPGTPIGAAVVGGGRAMSANELAQAGRAVGSTPSTTIWQSRLPDGTLELSDRPPPTGASQVGQRSYVLPTEGVARQRADAEREYWRKQAEGFNRRQQDRDRLEQADAERRARSQPQPVYADTGAPVWYGAPRVRPWPGHGGPYFPPTFPPPFPPANGAVTLPGPVQGNGGSAYTSSPGAVQGRATGGFIGSGFATGR